MKQFGRLVASERYSYLCDNLKGFFNCVSEKPENFKETFYSSSKGKMYLNDFCFVSESLFSKLKKTEVFDDWVEISNGQKSWQGLSDHCPISIEFDL